MKLTDHYQLLDIGEGIPSCNYANAYYLAVQIQRIRNILNCTIIIHVAYVYNTHETDLLNPTMHRECRAAALMAIKYTSTELCTKLLNMREECLIPDGKIYRLRDTVVYIPQFDPNYINITINQNLF